MSRYVLQPSATLQGWWTVLDTESSLECIFKEGDFNGSQKFIINDEAKVAALSPDELAALASQMGDWLRDNHYHLLFPAEPAQEEEVDIADIQRRLGRMFADRRREMGLSVRQLAEKCGVNYVTISKIENGQYNATLATLAKIAAVLGIKIL